MKFKHILLWALFLRLSIAPVFAEESTPSPDSEESDSSTILDWRYWNMEYSREDMLVLPGANDNFFPLEYWFPGAVLSNPDNGGFAQIEPVTLSLHGESVKWTRYHINALDMTNPADPGKPLIYVPMSLWKNYQVLSPLASLSNNFGLNWNIGQSQTSGGMAALGTSGFLGGDTWIPKNFMDREPAQDYGASDKRRSLAPSPDETLGLNFSGIAGLPASLFYEGLTQKRTFTTLDGYETGNRNTVYLGQNLSDKSALSAIFQHIDRDHFGIETGNSDIFSLHGGSDSLLLTLSPLKSEEDKFSYGVNAGYGHTRYEQNNPNPRVQDLIDEIVYGKLPEPKDSKTWFVGNNLDFKDIAKIWIFDFSVFSKIRIEGVHEQNLYKNNMIAHTYNNLPYDVTYYSSNNPYSQYLVRLNPEAVLEKKWKDVNLELHAGFLFENGFSNSASLVSKIDPVASIKFFSNPGNKWEIFTGLMHDAIPLSSDEVKFLNPDSPSGGRYSWNDNGNGIPENGELGSIYNVTGGQYHTLSADIKFPTRDEFYLGVIHNFSEKWRGKLSIHGKRYANLYLVNFDPSLGNAGYTQISRPDVLGGIAYNRDASAMGNELYMLGNLGEDAYYADVEFEIIKMNKGSDPWFFQATFGAYYAQAKTIPGNGPEYNDMGQFSESSADPNKQLNTLAITDSERAYKVNFLFGLNLGSFSIANSLRYRDGQPWGIMYILDNINQGPTIIQNGNRANPPQGIPRYTFALSWDVRLKYELPRSKVRSAVSLDIYNLFDSRTELYEHTLEDSLYRVPIESVTGRSFRIMYQMFW